MKRKQVNSNQPQAILSREQLLEMLDDYINGRITATPKNEPVSANVHFVVYYVSNEIKEHVKPFLVEYAYLLKQSGAQYIKGQYMRCLYAAWRQNQLFLHDLAGLMQTLDIESEHTKILEAILNYCSVYAPERLSLISKHPELLTGIFQGLKCNEKTLPICLDALSIWIEYLNKASHEFNPDAHQGFKRNLSFISKTICFIKQNMFHTQTEKLKFLQDCLSDFDSISAYEKLVSNKKPINRAWKLFAEMPPAAYTKANLRQVMEFVKVCQLHPGFFKARLPVLKSIDPERFTGEIVQNFFIDYNFPAWLLNDLTKERCSHHFSLLQWLLSGNNLRHYPDLPIDITKKAAHFIFNISETKELGNTEMANATVEWLTYFGQLRSSGVHGAFSREASNLLKNVTTVKSKDDWIRIFIHLFKMRIQPHELREVLDYVDQMRDIRFLKTTSAANPRRTVEEWHRILHEKQSLGRWYQRVLPNRGISKFEVTEEGAAYEIRQIETAMELYEEGRRMKHCVYSYVERCVEGHSSIFSLTKTHPGGDTVPLLTIEVNENAAIVQAKGWRNRTADPTEQKILALWAQKEQLRIAV